MIKLQEIVGLPTLQYHLDNKLTLSECVYRYSSDSFIQLFAEARKALRDGKIVLSEQDILLLENTDIGEYGMYEGQKVPLDLPMIDEGDYDSLEDEIANNEFGMDYDQLGPNEKEWVDDEVAKLNEAEYRGKDVPLNKPKRGGSKKFYVYTKNKKGNVVKVSFGAVDGGGALAVKLDDPKRRKAFADRHNCDKKTDKTTPGYWSCRLTRYAKQLGMKKNYSGYW
jgi:hypothetical protein